jgi:phosphoglycerol transferase MdoB-like AlkP superfamily enzyme
MAEQKEVTAALSGAPSASASPSGERTQPANSVSCSAFWFAFWLGAVLIATKAVHLGMPELSIDGLKDYAHNLSIITSADLVFTFAVGMTAQVALWCASRSAWMRNTVWALLTIFCLVCVVYAVVSVQVFSYLRSPLTYPLIYLAGDVKNMRSSVTAFASSSLIAALVGVPIGFILSAALTHRWIQPKRTPMFRTAQLACFGMLAACILYGRANAGGAWGDRNDRRIAENPHWTLFRSYVTEFLGNGRIVQLDETFGPEHLEDFQIVGERKEKAPPPPAGHRPRNVIVLVMESTATRYLDMYGGPFDGVAPRLQAEAAHAMVFNNFYCHVGLTANAVVAISLSIYPGMTWREYTIEYPRLPGTTTAQVLKPHGYRTAFIHNGDLEYTNQRGFLKDRGFDTMWDYRDLDGGVPDPNGFSWGVADRHLVDGILKWVDQDRDRPFFVLTWTIQAHHPYTEPVQDKKDFFQGSIPPGDDYDLDLYLNALHETDREIGRLLDGLRERGLADDTLVAITGDHGEAFGHPHDTYGHGAKLFQENVNVPLMLWNPKLFDGQRSETVGSQIDINPTVLHLLGIDPPPSWQGHSLFATKRPGRAYFYAANDDYLVGVREAEWKYIYNATTGRDLLYDVSQDPEEQRDVGPDHAGVRDELRKRLAAWLKYEQKLMESLHGAGAK